MQSGHDSRAHVRVLPEGERIDQHALLSFVRYDECGAVVTFAGVVRATEGGSAIRGLQYEAHPTMAESELCKVVATALDRYDVCRIACVHRTGFVPVREASVVIVVGADHRAAAFDACEFVIDELKKSVPVWKSDIPVGS
jgi:molybdopterin synthase catalytic subunit